MVHLDQVRFFEFLVFLKHVAEEELRRTDGLDLAVDAEIQQLLLNELVKSLDVRFFVAILAQGTLKWIRSFNLDIFLTIFA